MNIFKPGFFLSSLLSLLSLSSRAETENREAALLQQNIFPGDSWAISRAEDQGVDSAKLKAAFTYLGTKADASETVAIRNGYLIYQGKNATRSHGLWSCSKSFTSTVAGLLFEDGVVSLDTYAKDIDSSMKAQYPDVKLKHFATMTSGYDAKGGHYGPGSEDGSPTPFSISKPSFKPGTYYAYWDDAMRMYGAMLTLAARKSLKDIFSERVAKKIGMKKWSWSNEGTYKGKSIVDAAGGISTDALNLAKYCYLFLNKGKWNGVQVINEKWVLAATSNQVPVGTPVHKKSQGDQGAGYYGYNWWVNDVGNNGARLFPDAPEKTFAARGAKGNFCAVVPEWNMVLVRLGTDKGLGADTQNEFLKRVGQSLIK